MYEAATACGVSYFHPGRLPAIGESVYWRRTSATVVEHSASGKRVLIRAQVADFDTQLVYVKPQSLQPRQVQS